MPLFQQTNLYVKWTALFGDKAAAPGRRQVAAGGRQPATEGSGAKRGRAELSGGGEELTEPGGFVP